MNGGGLTSLEIGLSLVGQFARLGIAGSFGGLAAILFLLGALGGLGIAAAMFGTDSRDGPEW
jgi:hypothetical protein